MKQLQEGEALNKAAAYCTLCERCISEVSTKLIAWGVSNTSRHNILEQLQKEKFIDEERYCRAFVNDKIRFNHWGRIKIISALREKHLPQEYISTAISQIDEEEYLATLSAVIASKRKELKGADDYAAKQKIMRFAASRGYEPALIMNIIKYNPDEMD